MEEIPVEVIETAWVEGIAERLTGKLIARQAHINIAPKTK